MKRARQTAQSLQHSLQLVPIILEDLREVDFGDWTGLSWKEVKHQFEADAFEWLHFLDRGAIPNAECTKAWRRRVASCLDKILPPHLGQTVGLVCHGGVVRMFLSILLGLPLANTGAFAVEYASVSRIDHRPERTTLQLLNLTPWRDSP
jgi:alpha-ribazole phosphatase/probable phosphoglycerate mutase